MCTSPRFGLFIAYVNITIFGMGVIYCIAVLCKPNYFEQFAQEEALEDPTVHVKNYATILRNTVKFVLVLSLFLGAISGALVMGIIMRRHQYMVPWLVVHAFSIACVLVCDVATLFEDPLGIFQCAMCVTFVQCLIFSPIYSLYRDVRKDHRSKRSEMC